MLPGAFLHVVPLFCTLPRVSEFFRAFYSFTKQRQKHKTQLQHLAVVCDKHAMWNPAAHGAPAREAHVFMVKVGGFRAQNAREMLMGTW